VNERPKKKMNVRAWMQETCSGEWKSARLDRPEDRVASLERQYAIFVILRSSRSEHNLSSASSAAAELGWQRSLNRLLA
jgi:hypothetical protein